MTLSGKHGLCAGDFDGKNRARTDWLEIAILYFFIHSSAIWTFIANRLRNPRQ